VLVLNAVIDCN